MQIFVIINVHSLGEYPGVRLWSHKVSVYVEHCKKVAVWFLQHCYPILYSHQQYMKVPVVSILSALGIVSFLKKYFHSFECVAVSYYGFNLNFPIA